jgi:NADPH:quinone reductase-like Zn-dependent oxidoreductase
VQLAKVLGARVTGVETTQKLGLVGALGADRVVDYTRDDFVVSPETFDIILDVVGRRRVSDCLRSLHRGGYYLLANPSLSAIVLGRWAGALRGKHVIVRGARSRSEDLDFLRGLIESGTIRSVIDRGFPLEGIQAAHRYVDSRQPLGRVVITM